MAGALDGLKVLDLTRVLGGPYCTMVLADHGAEVIKVEPPQGDETREWGPPFVTRSEEGGTEEAGTEDRASAYFMGVNRNKRGMALDLGKPQGRAVLLRLLADADVLVENFKPGTLERWGLGYGQELAARFPRLIHCRVSGFGADGPLGGLPGYDAVLQAMTGLMSINGDAETGPMRMGSAIIDMATGLYCAVAILMAVQERHRSGLGQFIDMTLYDCGVALSHPYSANFLYSGKRPVGSGNPHPNIAPYDKFSTRTGDIYIAGGNDGQFRKLCAVLGAPALADDPRFATNAERVAHRQAMLEALNALLAPHDGEAIALELLRAGVPCGPVRYLDQVMTAPHTAHRHMVAEIGDYRAANTPIKFSRSAARLDRAPPRFGEETAAILREIGYSQGEIEAFAAGGITPKVRT